MPWLLGSQACEQTFQAARSMTGTFSTITVSTSGFIHRLHHLQILVILESEMLNPRVTVHVKTVGYVKQSKRLNLKCTFDEDTITTINEATKEAVNSVSELGIVFTDQELKDVISRPNT